jgi:hypothetical protein
VFSSNKQLPAEDHDTPTSVETDVPVGLSKSLAMRIRIILKIQKAAGVWMIFLRIAVRPRSDNKQHSQ